MKYSLFSGSTFKPWQLLRTALVRTRRAPLTGNGRMKCQTRGGVTWHFEQVWKPVTRTCYLTLPICGIPVNNSSSLPLLVNTSSSCRVGAAFEYTPAFPSPSPWSRRRPLPRRERRQEEETKPANAVAKLGGPSLPHRSPNSSFPKDQQV